jgi:hypothetical protein
VKRKEEIHPREALLRQGFGLTAGEADEDQAEIRQREIEDDHEGNVFLIIVGPSTSGRTGHGEG